MRYFSSAGYIVNKTRSSLDRNIVIVNMLVWLRDWCCWHWSFNFRYISIALNWLVIPLSLLNSTTYLIFF